MKPSVIGLARFMRRLRDTRLVALLIIGLAATFAYIQTCESERPDLRVMSVTRLDNLEVVGTTHGSGSAQFDGTLWGSGSATFNGTLYGSGSATFNSTAYVTGALTGSASIAAATGLYPKGISGPGIFAGTGDPNGLVTAAQGSLYFRTDLAQVWQNTNAGTAWTQFSSSTSTVPEAFYGPGYDGDVTISVNTTMTRPMAYNNLTINVGITLDPAGYPVFVKQTLTNNGKIARNGGAGGNGGPAGQQGAAGVPSTSNGFLPPGSAGGIGGAQAGGGGAGAACNNAPNNFWGGSTPSATNGLGTGQGGGGGVNSIGGAGAASTSHTNTAENIGGSLAMWENVDRARTTTNTAFGCAGGGGGGGRGGAGAAEGAGGGGGASGGWVVVRANKLAGSGTIESKGGAGGQPSQTANAGTINGKGGGGGGASGGVILLIYHEGTPYTVDVGPGSGGGVGSATGGPGGNGFDGIKYTYKM